MHFVTAYHEMIVHQDDDLEVRFFFQHVDVLGNLFVFAAVLLSNISDKV